MRVAAGATPQRRNAATLQRCNAATPQRRNAATPQRSSPPRRPLARPGPARPVGSPGGAGQGHRIRFARWEGGPPTPPRARLRARARHPLAGWARRARRADGCMRRGATGAGGPTPAPGLTDGSPSLGRGGACPLPLPGSSSLPPWSSSPASPTALGSGCTRRRARTPSLLRCPGGDSRGAPRPPPPGWGTWTPCLGSVWGACPVAAATCPPATWRRRASRTCGRRAAGGHGASSSRWPRRRGVPGRPPPRWRATRPSNSQW